MPTPESQSTKLIEHINFPKTIALKISVSSNQPQPCKFWGNKPIIRLTAFVI